MRNLAGRRFSATSRYHDSALRIDGSSQIVSLAKSPMGRLLGLIYPPTVPASISTHIRKRLSPLPLEYAQQVRIVDTVAPQMLGVAAPASSLNSHRSSERHCHQTRRCCARRHDRFAPESGQLASVSACRVRATSRHMHAANSTAIRLPRRHSRNETLWNIGWGQPRQSALRLAARITLPHFSVWSAMNFPNSADVINTGSTPRPASRAFMRGSTATALISLLSLSITSAGVSFGAPSPYQ